MALILNRTKHYLHRYYSHIHISFLHRCSYSQTLISKPTLSHFPPFSLRFFAAPIQFLKKEEAKKVTGVRLNEQIRADFVRLVSDEGHSILARHEALRRAKSLKLDLVEVDRHAKPPVCKILDYNKERYQQQVKEKERAKKKSEGSLKKGDCKEVRFSAKTETKDLKMKADTAKRLMERGYRVKCMVMGTEEQDLGGLLSQLSSMIEEVAFIESGPRIEKKQAYIIARHIKFGPSKKGGKKASKVDGTFSSEIHNVADACNNSRADELEEEVASSSTEEYATDNDNTTSHGQEEMVCGVSDANHDRNRSNSSTEKQMKFHTKVSTSTAVGSSPSRMPDYVDQNVRSSSQEPEPENRYARNMAKNVSAPSNTRLPNNGNHPHSRGGFVQGGGPRQDRDRGDVSIPCQVGPTEPRTGAGSLRSPSPGFGIFSAKEVDQCGSASNSTARNANPDILNSQSMKSSGDQRRGNTDGRKWGVFSR